MERLW